ncbi:hypothetical protein WJX79_009636 [Trebouxia sp. C0005]
MEVTLPTNSRQLARQARGSTGAQAKVASIAAVQAADAQQVHKSKQKKARTSNKQAHGLTYTKTVKSRACGGPIPSA